MCERRNMKEAIIEIESDAVSLRGVENGENRSHYIRVTARLTG